MNDTIELILVSLMSRRTLCRSFYSKDDATYSSQHKIAEAWNSSYSYDKPDTMSILRGLTAVTFITGNRYLICLACINEKSLPS
jgi:hypothetical protein